MLECHSKARGHDETSFVIRGTLQTWSPLFHIRLRQVCQEPSVTEETIRAAAARCADAPVVDGTGATPLHYICLNPAVTASLIRAVNDVCRGGAEVAATGQVPLSYNIFEGWRFMPTRCYPLHCICVNPNTTVCLHEFVRHARAHAYVHGGGGNQGCARISSRGYHQRGPLQYTILHIGDKPLHRGAAQ